MNLARWERIQELVEAALDQPEAVRQRFLETACGADQALREEVRSLLDAPAADELPTGWLGALADVEPARFVSGQRVAGRYVIGALLGRGGMGEVYEARDDELGITVALKTLMQAGDAEEELRRLKLEGLLARAVWHPNVCRVYDLGRHDGDGEALWFLTMERLHGVTLAERLRSAGALEIGDALRFAEDMAAGLGAAHQVGVVHRDLKPGNVMLVERDGREQAVVTDFGTARAATRPESVEHAGRHTPIFGTPGYMAPEQWVGDDVGPPADLYALGVVLCEMVTGVSPFVGDSAALTPRSQEQPPRIVGPGLDDRWDRVIRRCLTEDPRGRFARAEDVADALAGRAVASAESMERVARHRHSLPAERDLFLGRLDELDQLAGRLARSRLVSLVGTAGTGKTRLALRHAWRSLSDWPGGAWFCDLSEARSASGIAGAVAASLGIPIGRGDPIEQLANSIAARRRCLVVLDNFEQVVPHAAETVGRWMEHAPEACFLVTSRMRLSLGAEQVQTVEPLSIELGLELFGARARALRPSVELVGGEGEAAREIVRLVDGLPLAIELAAARMRVMNAVQIAAQMRKRFQLLTGGRDARHESLERAIDSSWESLTAHEQAAWAQCSVFEGGFTLSAAEDVLKRDGHAEPPPAFDVIRSLVDKSLLRTWVPRPYLDGALPEIRFGMYATLQDYARMKLRAMNAGFGSEGALVSAETAAELRHGAWYARHGTEEAIEALDRHHGIARRRRLELEIENVMAACRRAARRGDRLAAPTYRAAVEVLALRGPYEDAVRLGHEVFQTPGLEPADRAHVLRALGQAERLQGRLEDARGHWEEALAVAREAGVRKLEGTLIGSLGILHVEQGHMDEARDHFEAARAIQHELGERRSEGVFTVYLGTVAMDQSRMDEARTRLEAALAVHRQVGDRRFEGLALGNLAILHREQGRLEEARRHCEQALAIHREAGDRRSEGLLLGQLGNVSVDLGRALEARVQYEAALEIFRDVGARRAEGSYLFNLGNAHRRLGDLNQARSCFEAALAIHRDVRDRRFEGIVQANLGDLLQQEDRLAEAHEALARADEILREIDARNELGKLLCSRARLERRRGNEAFASAALAEARAIAAQMGAGPDSELGQMLARAGADARAAPQ